MTDRTCRPTRVSFGDHRGWRVELPERKPLATPAIDQGLVFLGGGYGSHGFYAFHAETGESVWHLKTKDDGPTAAVAVGGCVVFNTESCTLYVVDGASGHVLWERWLGDPLMAQPAADAERVYMAYPDSRREHRLACFGLKSGEPLWEAPLGHDIVTAPILHGGAVFVSTYDGKVHRFCAESGAAEWSRDYRATSAPWVEGERVLVSTRVEGAHAPVEEVYSHDSTTGRRTGRRAYSSSEAAYLRSKRGTADGARSDFLDASVGFSAPPPGAKLDRVESLVGEHRVYGSWRYQGSRPVVARGRCFLIVGDALHCSDVASEESLWQKEPGEDRSLTRRFSPPAPANGKLFLAGADGSLGAFDEASGDPLWTCEIGEPLEWSPAVAGGRVYLGTAAGRLVCIETGDPADTGWPMWGGGPGHNGSASEVMALALVP